MTHLTLGPRYEISILNEQGVSKTEIGRNLGKHRSTVIRELKRNSDGRNGQYKAELAQKKSCTRHKQKNKHKNFTADVKDYVTYWLKKAGRGHIANRTDISQRPAVVDKKQRIGDLEIDLIIGKNHKGALLTINDRATGVLKMAHIKGKETKDVEIMTKELLEDWIPFIHTITSDNGKEFANHEAIAGKEEPTKT